MSSISKIASLSASRAASSQSAAERLTRVKLAGCYRLAARRRFTDHIFTHFSARVPGPHEHFLINPYGTTFDEVTASNLVKVTVSVEILDDSTGMGINQAGFIIHSAIHAARPDLMCVFHTHTAAGIAVACRPEGLLMLSQHAMRFHGRIGYHDYDGTPLDMDERARLARNLGTGDTMILRNHGLLVCGTSFEAAFRDLESLERACQVQVAAGHDTPLPPNSEEVAARLASVSMSLRTDAFHAKYWQACERELERHEPDYKD